MEEIGKEHWESVLLCCESKYGGWNSSEIMGEEEIEAWRLAPRTLIRNLQKDVMHSARLRSIFSGISSLYIQPFQPTPLFFFPLWLMSQLHSMAVTPSLIIRGGRDTLHHLVTEKKEVHSHIDRASYALAPLGNWGLSIDFYTSILVNIAIRLPATWEHWI